MMLLYRAWRESQVRFLLAAVVITGVCVFAVLFPSRTTTYSEHIDELIYAGEAKALFTFLAIFLGLGGLRREHARHTAAFTLALPCSRTQLVVAQLAMGLAEIAALALLPALLIPSLSALVHQSYAALEPYASACSGSAAVLSSSRRRISCRLLSGVNTRPR